MKSTSVKCMIRWTTTIMIKLIHESQEVVSKMGIKSESTADFTGEIIFERMEESMILKTTRRVIICS